MEDFQHSALLGLPKSYKHLIESLPAGDNFVPLNDALCVWRAKLGIQTSLFLGQTMDVRLALQLSEIFVEDVGVLWVTASEECHGVLARNFYHSEKKIHSVLESVSHIQTQTIYKLSA